MVSAVLRSLQERDRAHHLHPFTNHAEMHAAGTHLIQSAAGCWVVDEHGNKLLDALAGLWCVNVGHGRSEIIDAVAAQMRAVAYYPSFFNTTTEPAVRLAERLAEIAPARLQRVMFSNSGSEANETALKLIRAYYKLKGKPQKTKIVTRDYAYHGVTLATTSMTGLPNCQTPFDLPLPGFLHAPAPYPYGASSALDPEAYGRWCVQETAKLIEKEGPETIGALFAEPVQGAGGVIVPPEGYLRALQGLCREYDILFVADEVITGFGRLGGWFASTLWGLDPDLMCLAKGITSGYMPLGATLVSGEIADVLIQGGYLAHGFTYSGHPTAAAAGLANIDLITHEGLVGRTRDVTGPYLQRKLREFSGHPAVAEIRGCGLIGAMELMPPGGRAALRPDSFLGLKAAGLIREEGVIVRGIRDLIAVAPPLVVTAEEIDLMCAGIRRGLDRLCAQPTR